MKRVAAVAVLAALAGCDRAAAPPASVANTSVETTAPAPAPVANRLPTGEQVRGTVSSLTGTISGFARRETDTQVIIDVAADTLFEFDKAELTPAAQDNLAKVADAIRAGAPGPIEIIGHTDSKGDPLYNQSLSERRAQAVATWMGQQVGMRLRQFIVGGKGEDEPVATNTRPDGSDDPAGRARNRRVEIRIPK